MDIIKKNNNGKIIYRESSENKNDWEKWEWDDKNRCIYYETSAGHFIEKSFENDGSVIVHFENINGYVEDFLYNKNHELEFYSNNKGAEITFSKYSDET